ncbi:FecR domain-containing protein, partial [Elusimicrobiota bacterium]
MKKIISLAVALAFACANPGFTQLPRIGVAGGVAGRVRALAPTPGAAGRIMSSGKTVYNRDKISTDARGRMQVLLLDETVFTIGPNSEMELDEFIYDPFTNSGKISASVTKGVFRFVSGKIARKNPSDMKVKLPTGTIGIRGTIAAGNVSGFPILVALVGPGPNNNANERPGMITVTSGGSTVKITRPGFGVMIPGPGQPPSLPFKLTPKQYEQLQTKPKAQPGGSGGA